MERRTWIFAASVIAAWLAASGSAAPSEGGATTPFANVQVVPSAAKGGDVAGYERWRRNDGLVFSAEALGNRLTITFHDRGEDSVRRVFSFGALIGAIRHDPVSEKVYVALEGGKLATIDVSDPWSPRPGPESETLLQKPRTLAVGGNWIHVKDEGFLFSFALDDLSLGSQRPADPFSPALAATAGRVAFASEGGPMGSGTTVLDTSVFPFAQVSYLPGPALGLAFDEAGNLVSGNFFGMTRASMPSGMPSGFLPISGGAGLVECAPGGAYFTATLLGDLIQVDGSNPNALGLVDCVPLADDPYSPLDPVDLDVRRNADGSLRVDASLAYKISTFDTQTTLEEATRTDRRTGGTAIDVDVEGRAAATAWQDVGMEAAEFDAEFWKDVDAIAGPCTHVFLWPEEGEEPEPRAALAVPTPQPMPAPGGALLLTAGLEGGLYRIDGGAAEPLAPYSGQQVFAVESAERTAPGARGGALRHAFAIEYPIGLRVHDITDPTDPVPLGSTAEVLSTSPDLAVRGDLVAVAQNWLGVALVDVADPDSPEVVGSVPGTFGAVALGGSRLYAGTPHGFAIYDVSVPSTPALLGELTIAPEAETLDLDLERRSFGGSAPVPVLWVAAGPAGIRAYVVSDPSNPVEIASWPALDSAHALAVAGRQIWVAAGRQGLVQLSILDAAAGRAAAPSGPEVTAPLPLASSPNPFRGSTSVSFEMPQHAAVSLEVIDVAGRRVAGLIERSMPAGAHSVRWDGRDGAGRPVPAGCYFVRLQADGRTATRKVVVVN
jgi:hypothetical protein